MNWIDRLIATEDAMVEQAVARERERSNAAFEQAMQQTWQMIDPLNPPPAGSYARGRHEGIAVTLTTLRDNYQRAQRTRGVNGPLAGQRQEGGNGA